MRTASGARRSLRPPVSSAAGWSTGRPPGSATVARGLPRDGAAVGKSGVSRGFGGSKSGWGS